MSQRDGTRNRQRSSRFFLALLCTPLVLHCSLLLGELPEPVADAPGTSTAGRGGAGGMNRGGNSANGGSVDPGYGGQQETGGSTAVTPAGGVAAGGTPSPPGGDGGQFATAGHGGTASSNGGTTTSEGGSASGGNGGNGGSAGIVGCPCDCDEDGALNDDPGCHTGAGPADCDDSDDNVRPGQTEFFDQESVGGTFDYNCDETIEREFGTLAACNLIAIGQCAPDEAFESPPQCGQDGNWARCELASNGLSCQAGVLYQKTLRCR